MNESAYWIAIAHLPRWRNSRITSMISGFPGRNLTLESFFSLSEEQWKNDFEMNDKEISDLNRAKSELPNSAFLAETITAQGFEIIPITSKDYPEILKTNLKENAPPLLYIKGNKKILEEKSLAIVGSRNASKKSLDFTDNIAKLSSKEFKVVVSGFAKGVDKQALDSAIKYIGQSIIVLPQGILTFNKGYETYYRQIVDGNILVLSTFFPEAPWLVELAMARNSTIYALASEIYVAESSDKGGTWSGVIDGLRKGRKIYVRKPDEDEENANNLLIEKGAIPVDFDGKVIGDENPGKKIENEQTSLFG